MGARAANMFTGTLNNLKENMLEDERTIKEFFGTFNCDVKVYQNRRVSEFIDIVETIVTGQYEWLVLFVMARGKKDMVVGIDQKKMSLSEIVEKVQNRFPKIPKLVFAQLYQHSGSAVINSTQNPLEFEEMLVVMSATRGTCITVTFFFTTKDL